MDFFMKEQRIYADMTNGSASINTRQVVSWSNRLPTCLTREKHSLQQINTFSHKIYSLDNYYDATMITFMMLLEMF